MLFVLFYFVQPTNCLSDSTVLTDFYFPKAPFLSAFKSCFFDRVRKPLFPGYPLPSGQPHHICVPNGSPPTIADRASGLTTLWALPHLPILDSSSALGGCGNGTTGLSPRKGYSWPVGCRLGLCYPAPGGGHPVSLCMSLLRRARRTLSAGSDITLCHSW